MPSCHGLFCVSAAHSPRPRVPRAKAGSVSPLSRLAVRRSSAPSTCLSSVMGWRTYRASLDPSLSYARGYGQPTLLAVFPEVPTSSTYRGGCPSHPRNGGKLPRGYLDRRGATGGRPLVGWFENISGRKKISYKNITYKNITYKNNPTIKLQNPFPETTVQPLFATKRELVANNRAHPLQDTTHG